MLNAKANGLFVDASEFSILAARTRNFAGPLVVEEVAELQLTSGTRSDEVKDFLESFVDFKASSFYVSRCGVYPKDRFVRLFEADSINKVKDMAYLAKILRSEFEVDPDTSSIAILDARDGSDFDPAMATGKEVLFCGAPTSSFSAEQKTLLSYGLYPERMMLATLATPGGVADYTGKYGPKGPVLLCELTSERANVFIVNKGKVDVARSIPFGLDSIYPLLQRELGLKDELSARKLFFSNTFDFAEMGPKLLRRLTKELQATTGFYEVQNGQTVEQVFVGVLPKNLSWVGKTISSALGVQELVPNVNKWLADLDITLEDGVELSQFGSRSLGLFSLMAKLNKPLEMTNG